MRSKILTCQPQTVSILIGRRSNVVQSEWGNQRDGLWLARKDLATHFSIIKNSQRRTQIHSKSLKKPLLRQKDDYTPQVR